MRLILNPNRKDNPYLGFECIEPISYGYDSKGFLKTILCKALYGDTGTFTIDAAVSSSGEVGLICITGEDIGEDLMMNYTVVD